MSAAGGGSVDESVYKDVQVDARSDGIQCIGARGLSLGVSSPAQSCRLPARTAAAVVRVSVWLQYEITR